MICYFTRTEFEPKETEHNACPSTDINLLSNVLSFMFDLNILSYKPHCFACLRLHTLTLAPVSAMTFASELLTKTSTLKSPLYSLVPVDVVILKRLILYISSAFGCFSLSNCSTFFMFLLLHSLLKCPVS